MYMHFYVHVLIVIGQEETEVEKANWSLNMSSASMMKVVCHFRSHLHVPEKHPLTGQMFCDPGHVQKVCCLQQTYA